MASTVQKIATLGDHRPIPFDKLMLSQSNVRRIKHGISIEDLAEDIARRGLLQNLNARPVLDEAGEPTGMFEVPAGGRRFRALALLVKAKRLAKTAPIPCNVRDANSPIPAAEDSLAENARQVALHPLDQFRAFKTQVDDGASIDDVAARFFVTPAVVRQRLRLASVAPDLLDVFAEDGMSLEQLMAFTVSGDHARQLQVWEQIQRSPYRQPHYIRQALTEGAVHAGDRRAVFVGVEAYEAAGGTLTRDLFEQDRGGWFDDTALLDRLATEKLASEAEALTAEGWKWIEVALDFPFGHGNEFRRVYGRRPEFSEEEQEAHSAQVDELDQLYAEYEGDDDVPHTVIERIETLEAAVEAFTSPALIFDPTEVARAGVYLSLGSEGRLRIERGYVRPEDEAPAAEPGAAGGDARAATGTVVTIGGVAPDEPEEDEGALKPLSERLVTELTAFRTLALRDAVARHAEMAHIAVLHVLALSAFYHYAQDSCLEITVKSSGLSGAAPTLGESDPAKAIEARHQFWAGCLPDQPTELWAVLVALSLDERQALFAHCASIAVNVTHEQFNRRPRAMAHGRVLGQAVALDLVAAGWQPTVDHYLGKVTKGRILEAVRDGKGEMAAQLIDHLKKLEMAKEAERLLADTGWLPEPLRGEPDLALPQAANAAGDDAEELPAFLTGTEADTDAAPIAVAAE